MAVLYAASFLIPRPISTYQTYELTPLEYRLLSLTVFIPLALIWFAAFYGYAKLRIYSQKIIGTPEGPHIARLTTGIMILALGLPVTSLFSAATGLLIQHQPEWTGFSVVVKNYINVFIPLTGFMFLSWGARGLAQRSRQHSSYRTFALFTLVFAVIGVTYCYLTLTAPDLASSHHMPGWLVSLTLTLPYLYTWFLGLIAAYHIHIYSRTVTGVVYRNAWKTLAQGLGVILIIRIAIQYIAAATAATSDMRLARLLLIIYVFEALYAIGYIIVAVGAKRLQKIEEV
jgi:hypothetical protein